MSYEESTVNISLEVASDQSANAQKLMKGSATGILLNDAAGGACVGVLQSNDGDALGKSVPVGIGGVVKCTAGGVIAAFTQVASTATGKLVAAGVGDVVLGTTLAAAAADGDLVPMIWQPQGQNNPA